MESGGGKERRLSQLVVFVSGRHQIRIRVRVATRIRDGRNGLTGGYDDCFGSGRSDWPIFCPPE